MDHSEELSKGAVVLGNDERLHTESGATDSAPQPVEYSASEDAPITSSEQGEPAPTNGENATDDPAEVDEPAASDVDSPTAQLDADSKGDAPVAQTEPAVHVEPDAPVVSDVQDAPVVETTDADESNDHAESLREREVAAAAADDEYAATDAPDAAPAPPAIPALEVNGTLGSYHIERVLRVSADERVYLAREINDAAPTSDAYVTLIERVTGGFGGATSVIALGLRHPRLLFPRAILSSGEREYLVVEARVTADGAPALTAADGARLDALNTLIAGAGLASALGYLHRNGIAHLHVSPDDITVFEGRGYLGGMENADYIGGEPETNAPLIARDANFLARSLGVLGGATEALTDETNTMRDLREIVAKGEAGAFTEPEEVAIACGSAVRAAGQTLPILNTDLSLAPLTLLTGMATSVGRVRSQNQDACAAITFDLRDDVTSGQPIGVFLVADGMGGEAHGEIASRLATRIVVAELAQHFAVPVVNHPAFAVTAEDADLAAESPSGGSLLDALSKAVNEANRHIRLFASQIGLATGTTITAIITRGGRAALAHLGDSRAYLLRGNVMAQLSEDHSVLARLQAIDHPLLSDPDAFVPRSMLYRSLGQEDDANPDLLDFMLVEGDRLLLCSDGLWDEIDGAALAQTLALAPDPQSCAERLVALANASGGHDNSTALVVFVQTATGLNDANPNSQPIPWATPEPMLSEDAR